MQLMNNGCFKNILILVLIIVSAGLLYGALGDYKKGGANSKQVDISEIVADINAKKTNKVTVEGNKINAKIDNNQEIFAYKEEGVGVKDYGITSDKVNIEVKNDTANSAFWNIVVSIFVPVLLMGGFIYFMMKGASGANSRAMSFGQTTARLFGANGQKKVAFADVAGLHESKAELMEVVDFLKNPAKFKNLGAELPKGVLLVGPPGCGKTLLAKAVAGEAAVPFFSLSASEFVEMFVGVGAARVRDLFTKAKRNAPCVIFIDELDAIGRQRGAGLGGSHDEREQTLNQILVEMDGFETDSRVIILAATNRPDVLDPALLRPGRFDRRVLIDLPDKKDRDAIMSIHAKNKPFAKNVDLMNVAKATAGFSGADLKNIVNEAAILAARENKKEINEDDLHQAIEKVMLGPERKSRVLSAKEKEIAAYHEAGHAIVGHLLPECDKVHKISIVSRGMAMGYTWSLPEEDRHLYSKEKFEQEIAQLLAGRVAEKIIFNQLTTGASNDLQKATKIARDMATVYGMSDKLGPVKLGEKEELIFLGRELGEHKNYSDEKASQIDSEVRNIVELGERMANKVLTTKKALLKKVATKLLTEEMVEGAELNRLLA